MIRRTCSTRPLVEAERDGRLGERERASLRRHLAACVECARFAEDLESIADWAKRSAPLSSKDADVDRDRSVRGLDHHRRRADLLRAAATGGNEASLRGRRTYPALLAAAIVVAGLIAFLPRQRGAVSTRLEAENVLTSIRETTIVMPIDDRAQFKRAKQGPVETIDLSDGGIDLVVRHLEPSERFIVRTGDAEVEVRGTIFRVEAMAGQLTRVNVTEGRVEVRLHPAAGVRVADTTFLLGASESWSLPTPRESACSPKEKPPLAAERTEPEPRPNTGERPAAEPAGRVPMSTGSLSRAISELERGDDSAAAKDLASSGDTDSEDAAFLLVVALDRAGSHADAAVAAQRYLDRFPNGFRRSEAQALVRPSAPR